MKISAFPFNSSFENFRFDFAEDSADFLTDYVKSAADREFLFFDVCNVAKAESLDRR